MAILPIGIRKAFYWRNVPKLLKQGLPGFKILSQIRGLGYGLSTSSFYKIFREVKVSIDLRPKVEAWPKDKPFPWQRAVITDTLQKQKYKYIIEFDVYDADGIIVETAHRSYLSNMRLTPHEAEVVSQEMANASPSPLPDWTFENPRLIEVWYKRKQKL